MVEHLWTPWRYQYISNVDKGEVSCVFCAALQKGDDRDVHIVFRGQSAFVILNRYPYNTGHLMIVPYRHIPLLTDATPEELNELMVLVQHSQQVLGEVYQAQGFNLGMNLGRCAGAGIVDHLHMHVLPRWAGDTNFMTVIGDARVLPEDLAVTFEKLQPLFSDFTLPRP
ncbi:MAG: HIT domain-containing protein [Acidobacteria bacterium]|nr:HIT domain-containing protein [Acidobacteriota bacterium]